VGITATIAESPATNDVFNISGGESVTLNQAIASIEAEVGKTAVLKHAPARIGDQRTTAGATEKVHAAFGFVPATSFSDGIRAQVEWQLAQ
jgi:UDP-glucuronate 4-epimerase